MMSLYSEVCRKCSQHITKSYSTSFYSSIRLLHKDLRQPVYDIYGFVRVADEIVDTFHAFNKKELLEEFTIGTWKAIRDGISINPVLHSFQEVVHKYNIPHNLIEAFLYSMHLDLSEQSYDDANELNKYIYGSAEVVGLMCLCVFCEGDQILYEQLKGFATHLGAAFQKVNFLRDIKSDMQELNRIYFPALLNTDADTNARQRIEDDIESDFRKSLDGIRKLPLKARYGVYTAYRYYHTLFLKIKSTHPQVLLSKRVRVPDYQKVLIMIKAGMYNKLNII